MAAYIANVGSATPLFDDQALNDKITDFNALLQSNLVYQRYKLAIEAFGQHYFPFASSILDNYVLPSTLRMNDTKSVIAQAVYNVHELNTLIIEDKISFGSYSKYIMTDSNMTFYTWPYDKIKDQITNLLKGVNVTLNADIHNGLLDSAVKFNDLQLKFVLQNKQLQSQFDETLLDFGLSLEIIDNCYYRCNEKFYYISFGGVISLGFSFQRHPDTGLPILRNKDYIQIQENDPFISPYTTWNVQITNKDDNFAKLKRFVNEPMNLTLTGAGQYVDRHWQPHICDNQTHVREWK